MNLDNKHISNKDLIIKYVFNETIGDETIVAKNLIENDIELSSYYNDIKKIHSAPVQEEFLHKIDVNKAKSDFFSKIDTENSCTETKKNTKKKKLIPLVLQISSVAAAVFFAVFLLNDPNDKEEPTILCSADSVQQSSLPDGSLVSMNERSKISFVEAENIRKVILDSGEVFFNVKKDSLKPFKIEVNSHYVTVVGTSFNVKKINEDSVEVSVFSGKVCVSSSADTANLLYLVKGDKCILTQNAVPEKENYSNSNFLYWKTKELSFDETEMSMVLKTLQETYGVEIDADTASFSTCKLTALFENQPLDAVLEIIASTFNAQLIEKEGTYYLKNNFPCN